MDTNPSPSPTAVTTSTPGLFRTKIPSTISFAVGVLLFFLPFVDIKCNEMSVKTVNGIELATGFQVKGPGSNSLFDNLETEQDKLDRNKTEKRDPNMFALSAFALGIAGLLLSFLNNKAGGIGGMVTGALSASAMIGMMVTVMLDLKKDTQVENNTDVKITVDFTVWVYIAMLAFWAAAYFSYRRNKTIKPPL